MPFLYLRPVLNWYNITIRELNTFLKWLFDNKFTEMQLKMQQLKTEKTVKKILVMMI